MSVDRSKYRKASAEEMSQKAEEMKAREANQSDRIVFLKVEPGINKFRILPAPVKAESSLFLFPKVTAFLPMLIDETDKDGNKTGNQIEKRIPVFNAKVHGNLSIDIVESYIEAARDKFSATCKDKKQLFEKLKPIIDWKTGIKYTSAWICYAYKYTGNGNNKIYGRLQLTDGVKKQLDSLCLRQGDTGAPIVVDLVSDVDQGKPIQWTSNPNAEDAKAKNKLNILFEENLELTDDELDMLESWDTLESLYTNSYTKKDFEKQCKGLQLFDKKMKLNIFDSPSFQSVLDSAKSEIESMLTESKVEKEEEPEKSEIPEVLQEMDKKTLMSLPKILELDVQIKTTTPPSKIRQILKETMIETYELEGSDSEINEQIANIINEAFDGSDASEDTDDDNDDANVETDFNEETEADDEEGSSNEEEDEDLKPSIPKKKSSLLEKYSKKKK